MAAKIVWYSFSWSPKVRVTPLSEAVFVAADALLEPRPTTRRRQGPPGTRARPRGGALQEAVVWGTSLIALHFLLVVEGRAAAGPVGGTRARRRVAGGLKGLVALNGHALNDTVRFAVVADGVVHGRPVVPEAEVAFLPAVTDDVLGRGHVLVEEAEEGVALLGGQTLDPLRESWVDEQVPAPGLGVCPHDGVFRGSQLGKGRLRPTLPGRPP